MNKIWLKYPNLDHSFLKLPIAQKYAKLKELLNLNNAKIGDKKQQVIILTDTDK